MLSAGVKVMDSNTGNGQLKEAGSREGNTLSDLGISSGPRTPSSHRNFFNAMKYGFLISSFKTLSLIGFQFSGQVHANE
jgi:hypothetical protein